MLALRTAAALRAAALRTDCMALLAPLYPRVTQRHKPHQQVTIIVDKNRVIFVFRRCDILIRVINASLRFIALVVTVCTLSPIGFEDQNIQEEGIEYTHIQQRSLYLKLSSELTKPVRNYN